MSEFSKLFKAEVKKSKKTLDELAEISGLSIDYVMKLKQGKRFPQDTGKVKKLIESLKATAEVTQKLILLYNEERMGETEWNCILEIKKLIEYRSNDWNAGQETGIKLTTEEELRQIEILKTEEEVCLFLQQVLDMDIQNMQNEKEQMLRIKSEKLPERIVNILAYYMNRSGAVCEHIFSLEKNKITGGILQNVRLINSVMPLIQSGGHYIAYCDYEETGELLLGNWILGNSWIVGLNSNMSSGMVIWNQEKVDYLKTIFDKKKRSKRQLIRYFDDMVMYLKEVCENRKRFLDNVSTEIFRNGDVKYYYMEDSPCVLYKIPFEIIEKHILIDGGTKKAVNGNDESAWTQASQEKYTHFFSEDGLDKLIKNGRISGVPDFIYSPITMEERIWILRIYRDWMKEHEGEYFMIDNKSMKLSPQVSVYGSVSVTDNTIAFSMTAGNNLFCIIDEQGMAEKLNKFFHMMVDGAFVCSNRKTIEVMDEKIRELEKICNKMR